MDGRDGRKNSQVSLMDVPRRSLPPGGISQSRDKLESTTYNSLPPVLQSRALRRYLISAAYTDKLPFLSLLLLVLLEASGQDDRGQR